MKRYNIALTLLYSFTAAATVSYYVWVHNRRYTEKECSFGLLFCFGGEGTGRPSARFINILLPT